MQPSTLYHRAAIERANDDRQPVRKRPPERLATDHSRQRALVRASLLRIPAPEER